MKKASSSTARKDKDTLRREYDFSGGVRGKHYRAMQGGYTITVRHRDGSTVIKEVKPNAGAVTLAPDVREYFPDSESVNAALRSLLASYLKNAERYRREHRMTREEALLSEPATVHATP